MASSRIPRSGCSQRSNHPFNFSGLPGSHVTLHVAYSGNKGHVTVTEILIRVITRLCDVREVPSHRPSQSLSANIWLVGDPHADRGQRKMEKAEQKRWELTSLLAPDDMVASSRTSPPSPPEPPQNSPLGFEAGPHTWVMSTPGSSGQGDRRRNKATALTDVYSWSNGFLQIHSEKGKKLTHKTLIFLI